MTSDIQNTEQAWDDFVEKRSFEKAASIQGQLDTMAAMIQDIKTDTERTAAIVDQIQGDNAAIDYENANAEMPPMEEPMEDVAENVPVEEGAVEEMPEGVEDIAADEVPVEGSEPAMEAGEPGAEMPPEGGEDVLPMEDVAEEPPVEEELAGAPEVDLIGKIKMLIANTDDPSQLAGLSDLLSAALAQSQPPVPMESMSEEPMLKSADGIADVEDAENAEEAVEVKTEEAPEPLTKSEDEKTEEEETEEEEEVEYTPDAPEVDEEKSMTEEIVDKVAEAVEGIVESVLEGDGDEEISDDTEPFEAMSEGEMYMKSVERSSFGELFAKSMSGHTGVDGQIAKCNDKGAIKEEVEEEIIEKSCSEKADDEPIEKTADNIVNIGDDSNMEKLSAVEGFKDNIDEKGQITEVTRADDPINKAATGKHIPSFREMYSDKDGFVKSTPSYIQTDRPGTESIVGGSVQKANLNSITKSAEKKPLQLGYGVDPHEAVADDWARYRAIMGYDQ